MGCLGDKRELIKVLQLTEMAVSLSMYYGVHNIIIHIANLNIVEEYIIINSFFLEKRGSIALQ